MYDSIKPIDHSFCIFADINVLRKLVVFRHGIEHHFEGRPRFVRPALLPKIKGMVAGCHDVTQNGNSLYERPQEDLSGE